MSYRTHVIYPQPSSLSLISSSIYRNHDGDKISKVKRIAKLNNLQPDGRSSISRWQLTKTLKNQTKDSQFNK